VRTHFFNPLAPMADAIVFARTVGAAIRAEGAAP
jgi:hypothetical protein